MTSPSIATRTGPRHPVMQLFARLAAGLDGAIYDWDDDEAIAAPSSSERAPA